MKLEIWLIQSESPSKKLKVDVDFPAIPRSGERIMLGETEGYDVKDVIYRLDTEGRFTGRITIDAYSPHL